VEDNPTTVAWGKHPSRRAQHGEAARHRVAASSQDMAAAPPHERHVRRCVITREAHAAGLGRVSMPVPHSGSRTTKKERGRRREGADRRATRSSGSRRGSRAPSQCSRAARARERERRKKIRFDMLNR
jgi:hypothetical protein